MGFQKGLAAPISSKFTTFFAFCLLIPIIFQAIEVDLSHDVPERSSVKICKILMSGLILEQSMLSLVFASPGAQPVTITRQGNGNRTRQWRTKLTTKFKMAGVVAGVPKTQLHALQIQL